MRDEDATPSRGTEARATEKPASPSRRTLLKLGAVGVAAGVAGCAAPRGHSVRPTPAESPDETPDGVADFEMGEPPIDTPWTGEVDPANPRPEYPRPQLTRRRWASLNGVWGLETASAGESPPVGETLSESVLVPFPIESAISGIMREETDVWYRRTFSVPDDWDERVLLHLDAVDFEARVFVNGREVGSHRGGYDRFSLDVTDALRDSGEQELVVRVHDPTDRGPQALGKQRLEPGGIYYTSCTGIWGSAWLEPVPAARVAGLDLRPELEDETLRVTVDAPEDPGLEVRAFASADGRRVGSVEGAPNEELALSIPDPHRWSPDDPFLYDLRVELHREDELVDAVGSYFGMRSVGMEEVDGTPRLTLNGEPVFHMATLDQGYWPDGIYTAPTDAALRYDLEKHVDLGFNAVRKHVKVEPDRWYHWADRLGLLVWQDMASAVQRGEEPPEPAQEQFEVELRRMIDQHGNHPSIVMWVPFNEGWGTYDVPRIVDLIREEDPNRLVDSQSGINVCQGTGRICGPIDAGDVVDWHVYPGPGVPPPSADQASVLGEYGGMGLQVEDHLWDPDEEYSYARMSDAAELTDTYVEKLEQVTSAIGGCGGLSAAIYTQITDVEIEVNGLLTYDRRVTKPDADRIRSAHEALFEHAEEVLGGGEGTPTPTGGGDLDGAGYWPFEEGEGTTTADEAGDADARLVDLLGEPPQWTDGRVGGALEFDGYRNFVDTDASVVDTSGPFSVAAWVRLAERSTTKTAVSQDADPESAFSLQYVGGEDRFAFDVAGSRITADVPVETGRWYHLAGTVSGCTGRLFVDGELAGIATVTGDLTSGGNTIVGRGMSGGVVAEFWEGAIDEVHVYNRAITRAEVARLADEG